VKPEDHLIAADGPIRLGVSSCLLGARVRFDGGHKRSRFLVDTLGRFVEFVPVCPEVEIGLGVPRETLRLVRRGGEGRMVANETGIDHTQKMNAYADRRVAALGHEKLCGYVLKNNSASCGMEQVRVYRACGSPARPGPGLFAAALMRRYPNLPVEEEERLRDPRLRENFIERIFAYHRLRSFFSPRWTLDGLARFHAAHRLALMAHSPQAWAKLGRIVANAKRMRRDRVAAGYEHEFMRALKRPATRAGHGRVLRHMLSRLRPRLDPKTRADLAATVEDYSRGLVPLAKAIARFRRCARRFGIGYLRAQVYLEPGPVERMLRSRAGRGFDPV